MTRPPKTGRVVEGAPMQKRPAKKTAKKAAAAPAAAAHRPSALQTKLAVRVVELLRERDFVPGQHVKEEFLTEQFRVSRSPVRGALKLLAEKGLLEARANQGYFLAEALDSKQARALALPPPEDDRLYERIVADRFDGQLAERFTEADLVRRYEASRADLSRVLLRLSEEGLVQRGPGRSWLFQPSFTSVEAHDESYWFRLVVEPAGLLSPTFTVDEARLRACQKRHEQLLNGSIKGEKAAVEFRNANAEFHQMLADFSGNRFVQQAVQHQNRLRRLAEFRADTAPARMKESCEEHLAILEAVAKGDREWASTLLRRHIEVASQLRLAFALPR
jgi:DNA-binding GntR family transcriptional regulator